MNRSIALALMQMTEEDLEIAHRVRLPIQASLRADQKDAYQMTDARYYITSLGYTPARYVREAQQS